MLLAHAALALLLAAPPSSDAAPSQLATSSGAAPSPAPPLGPDLARPPITAPSAAGPSPAPSVVPSPAPPPAVGGWRSGWKRGVKDTALFLGGSLSAFTLHEGGHLVANLAYGNTPHLEPVSFAGVIPFFSITSDVTCRGDVCTYPTAGGRAPFGGGRRGLFTILMAGFHVQHLSDEVILSLRPKLRDQEAPFRKGMLAFNTLTSIGYVAANWLGLEPEKGDLYGAYAMTGAPRHVVNSLLLGIAALDLARYAFPDVRWLAWASRAAKVGLAGVTFTL